MCNIKLNALNFVFINLLCKLVNKLMLGISKKILFGQSCYLIVFKCLSLAFL